MQFYVTYSIMSRVIQWTAVYSRKRNTQRADHFVKGEMSDGRKAPTSYTLPSVERYKETGDSTETYTNLAFQGHL